MITVEQILIYPIKSTWCISLKDAEVTKRGLIYDRNFALFNINGQALTARECPILLDIQCKIESDFISINYKKKEVGRLPFHNSSSHSHPLKVHSYSTFGNAISDELDRWFSNFLSSPCRIMAVDLKNQRPVLEKHGGQKNDELGFGDQAPILILSKASLTDLNSRMEDKIGMDRFRPNIVVSGWDAYEEDHWENFKIGNCTFRVIQQCERCVLTTIDPETKIKHQMSEPLRTLSKYRKGLKGGVVMGVHAVPVHTGTFHVGNEVQVETQNIRNVTS